MARVVTAENLRARLGQELDWLKASSDVVYVSKRGRLAPVLIDVDRYADIVERLEFLVDSLAVLEARRDVEKAVPWKTVRRT